MPTSWPRVHHLALPRMWSQSIRETLLTDNREWPYRYLYLRFARLLLLLLQPAASGALSKLSAEQAHCLFIVAGVASRCKTCSRMTSSFVPRLCGVRRCNSSDRRHSKWVPVVCGVWMFKILISVAGMIWFRACTMVNHTNRNIQHTRFGNTNSYPMRIGY